jgi:ABC-type dipeptide/oligopeptide/nickel transport system permease subunit
MKEKPVRSPGYLVWERFRRKKLSLFAGLLVVLAVLVSLLGYLITPDSTPHANSMNLALALKKPGFSVSILNIRKNRVEEEQGFVKTMLSGRESRFEAVPIEGYSFDSTFMVVKEYTGLEAEHAASGLSRRISLADIVYALNEDAPVVLKDSLVHFTDVEGVQHARPLKELRELAAQSVTRKKFLLGSDRYGRDVLSRLLIGTRVTLSVGMISVFISLVVGIGLGALAGFYRGWVDNLVMWFINVVWSVPTLLLVVAVTLALGKGFWQVFVAVGLTMWVEVARVVRGQIFSIREMEYVEAARALGYKSSRTIFRHILPNIIGPVIVIAASNFASAILLEAGLSFLGVGAQPPAPSWGTMIRENYPYIIMNLAYLAILPGLFIMLMVLAFNLIGNGLRDAFDTKEL